MITPELLRAATGCTQDRADLFASPLTDACAQFHIDNPTRLAAFLAQIAHESSSLAKLVEGWGPTPEQLRYEGRLRLGNIQPGDGERFKGHGLIQVTGRANHAAARNALRAQVDPAAPDFEADPEALTQPRWAAMSAAHYWASHGCNELADAGDFAAITRSINGGLNGYDDRLKRWERAKAALAVSAPPEAPPPAVADPGQPQRHLQTEWDLNNPAPAAPPDKGPAMAPFVIPAVLELAKLIPRLGGMFGGSEVAQRNVAAAGVVVDAVVGAVGASNAQQAVEKVSTDPAAREAATKAVEAVWYQISEAGGGGIEGARKADAAFALSGGPWWQFLASPSFWALVLMLPLVYMIVGSLIGVLGSATWSNDVRAGLAGMITGTIIGGAAGYYWGQTTSRNRSAAP